MPRSNKEKRDRREYEIMLAYMVGKYPLAFFPRGKEPRALKIGIVDDLLQDNPEVPPRQIRRFVGSYTRKNGYFRAIVDNVFRIGMDGSIVSKVHTDNKKFAAAMLDQRKSGSRVV